MNLTSIQEDVGLSLAPPSRLRIQHCHCCGMDSMPGLGNSVHYGCRQKKKKSLSKKQKLYPVSIVLVNGNSAFSDIIVKVTNGPYSHSALCLDNDFKRLYSFNADNKFNKAGGFSLESIAEYAPENIAVCFVLGLGHIAFVAGAQAVYYNENNGAQAQEYAKAYAHIKNLPLVAHSGMPTAEKQAGGLSLDQLLEKAGASESENTGF